METTMSRSFPVTAASLTPAAAAAPPPPPSFSLSSSYFFSRGKKAREEEHELNRKEGGMEICACIPPSLPPSLPSLHFLLPAQLRQHQE